MAWNTTINTSLLTTYLIRKFIPALENELQLQKFTTKATIPAGMGKIGRFNLWSSPAAQTTALTEGGSRHAGTVNEITTLTTTGTEATIEEWGEFIVTTELETYAAVPRAREEVAKRLAYGAALTLDTLTRDGQSALGTGYIDTTTVFHCTGAASGGTTTLAVPLAGSASALIGSAKLLRDNNAQGFNISGHPPGHFAAIVSPKFELDMVTEATTTRMTWAEAVTDVPGDLGQSKWVKGFMGSVYGTACYRTQNVTLTTVTATSSENNWVVADGGVGAVDIGDMKPDIFINTASSNDTGNPYRNHNTVAWHAYYGCALVDNNRVVVYSAA